MNDLTLLKMPENYKVKCPHCKSNILVNEGGIFKSISGTCFYGGDSINIENKLSALGLSDRCKNYDCELNCGYCPQCKERIYQISINYIVKPETENVDLINSSLWFNVETEIISNMIVQNNSKKHRSVMPKNWLLSVYKTPAGIMQCHSMGIDTNTHNSKNKAAYSFLSIMCSGIKLDSVKGQDNEIYT